MTAVLAIDQGTTGSRALLIGHGGRLLGSAYREFRQYFPSPGEVEHSAEEVWDSVRLTVAEALERAGLVPGHVAAVGITNQRETTIVWDRHTGTPAGPAIVWQDRRTSERCQALRGTADEQMIRDRTGLVVDPYFSGTKIEWLLERNPDWLSRAEAGDLVFGTVDSWLVYRLTGGRVHATDHTNASRTLLYSLDTRAWDPDLCGLFGVPAVMLPEVRSSAGDYGVTDPDVFGAEVPVAGVVGDQQAALYGQGAWTADTAKATYGTGAFVLLHTGDVRRQAAEGVLTTAACGPRGEFAYAFEGSILIAGAAMQWLRDGLGLIDDAAQSEAMARAVDDTGGVYFVPAFAGLGTPWWEPRARGTVVGLTRGTQREHLVRATLEAMAYSTRDVLDAMTEGRPDCIDSLRADGGAARNGWLMQFQADVLGTPVSVPAAAELTAIGAAGLAGLQTGFWSEPEQFLAARGEDRVFEPSAEGRDAAEAGREGWSRALATSRYWAANAGGGR